MITKEKFLEISTYQSILISRKTGIVYISSGKKIIAKYVSEINQNYIRNTYKKFD